MKTVEAVILFRALVMVSNMNEPMPPRFVHEAGINRRRLQPIVESFDAALEPLAEKYGARDEAGELKRPQGPGSFTVELARIPEFQAEHDPLADVEVNVELHMIHLDHFPKELPGNITEMLDPLIKTD